MGDQLGLNLWTAKSKYGATIQTALDYTMNVNPGSEDISDIFPHVAAVAAAYGDPKGKYAAFLQKHISSYKSQTFWFYDQTAALPRSPAAGKSKRDDIDGQPDVQMGSTVDTPAGDSTSPGATSPNIQFECPAVFDNALKTELEDGLFVGCDDLRPFYEIPLPVGAGTDS